MARSLGPSGILSLLDGEEYTAQEAALILRTTETTIRRRLERGDLDGRRYLTTGRWFVSARAVTADMPTGHPRSLSHSQTPPQRSQTSGQGGGPPEGARAPGRTPGAFRTDRVDAEGGP